MSVEGRGPAPASERGRAAAVPTGVVVAGAAGRMGSRIVACIHDSADLRVVAALEAPGHPALGRDAGEVAGLGRLGVALASDPAAAITRDRILVEFSTPEATLAHLRQVA
jgi:4-hydroxy-tetrahydrodipicolinate reductase